MPAGSVGIVGKFINLTLTSVVFECINYTSVNYKPVHLTLTSVVFE